MRVGIVSEIDGRQRVFDGLAVKIQGLAQLVKRRIEITELRIQPAYKHKRIFGYHGYIHSFRFTQAQNVMKIFFLSLFFFIILLVGNSVYYKSRGGEWAVRHAG